MESDKQIILASASPARAELLRRIGVDFVIHPSGANEPTEGFTNPRDLVSQAALVKAKAVSMETTRGLILAADTIGWIEGRPLFKPLSRSHAKEMLGKMGGKRHELWTGIVFWKKPEDWCLSWQEMSLVEVKAMTEKEIDHYLDTREWANQSGAYAIKENGDPHVTVVQGSISNVIGLPLESLSKYFRLFGIPIANG